MAIIHSVKINNFRGIKKFEEKFYDVNVICFVGRGDSGKSTILEAISLVLSSKWSLPIYDTDFFKSDTSKQIKIEVTLTNLPEELLTEAKYGLHIRVIDPKDGSIIDDIEESDENFEKALTIKLQIDESLEPEWLVVNNRQDPKTISSKDRSLLGVFLIADSTDTHFSWNQGNPLYSLLRRKTNEQDVDGKNLITQAVRDAKSAIDVYEFSTFEEAVEDIKVATSELGLDIGNVTTTMDFKKIFVGHQSVSLHEDKKIPFRLKGKGTKRLVSLGIQKVLASPDGVMLVDEIEQGLEPDRVKTLVRSLASGTVGQFFFSTHSQNVVEELEADNIFIVSNNAGTVKCSADNSERTQQLYRSCPEALYASKVIVCEGKTEIGVCRALDKYRIESKNASLSELGVVYSLGEGSSLVDKTRAVCELGMHTLLFCDSDDLNVNSNKQDLEKLGVTVIDCEENNSIEAQVFSDLPWDGVKKLIQYRISEKTAESVDNQIKSAHASWSGNIDNLDTVDGRNALAVASTNRDKSWFKSIRDGEILGEILFQYYSQIKDNNLKKQLDALLGWIDGNG